MSIPLKAEHKQRLRNEFIHMINHCERYKGKFIALKGNAGDYNPDKALPNKGPIKEALNNAIGEDIPVFTFFYSKLVDYLKNEKYDDTATNAPFISDPQELHIFVEETLLLFESLPWDYTYSFKLPSNLREAFLLSTDEIVLSKKVKLIKSGSSKFKNLYPLDDNGLSKPGLYGWGMLGREIDNNWGNDNEIILQYQIEGFLVDFGESNVSQKAKGLLRAFLGLCIATRLLIFLRKDISLNFISPPIAHLNSNNAWLLKQKLELEQDHREAIHHLSFNDLNGWANTDERKNKIFQDRIQEISKCFKHDKGKILLASQWLFDSYATKNSLLSFIQAMTCIEILLGNNEKNNDISLSQLLKNRCAYLIGKDIKSREMILNDFSKIYDVRSKILHRGHDKLNFEETNLLSKLRWICTRVIQEEISVLDTN